MGLGMILSSDVVLRFNSRENFSLGFPHMCLQRGLRMLVNQEKTSVLSLPASFEPESSLRSSVWGQTWDAP